MYRYKILQHFCSKCKPKIRKNILPISFKGNSLHSIQKNNYYKKVETPKIFKGFTMSRIFPSIKNSKMYFSELPISESTCWNCKDELKLKNFNCCKCGALQPPKPDLNYFELLGISQSFDVNLEEVTEKFRSMQMIFHPDKVEGKSQTEKEISETYSRLLNEAYKTLRDPVTRGFYLLESKQDSSKDENPLDPKFLSFIMEKNEEIETIDNLNALDKILKANNKQIQELFANIQQAFHDNDNLKAKLNLLRLNFLYKMKEKIEEKQSDFRSE